MTTDNRSFQERLAALNLPTGDQKRDAGLELVDWAEPEAWKIRADNWIAWRASQEGTFGADDLRRAIGPPTHPNSLGAAFSRARKAGMIEVAQTVVSSRPSRHSSIQRIWRGRR